MTCPSAEIPGNPPPLPTCGRPSGTSPPAWVQRNDSKLPVSSVPVTTVPSWETETGKPPSKMYWNVVVARAGDARSAKPAARAGTTRFMSRLPEGWKSRRPALRGSSCGTRLHTGVWTGGSEGCRLQSSIDPDDPTEGGALRRDEPREVEAGGRALSARIEAIPGDLPPARGLLAVQQRGDTPPGRVVHREIHARRGGQRELHARGRGRGIRDGSRQLEPGDRCGWGRRERPGGGDAERPLGVGRGEHLAESEDLGPVRGHRVEALDREVGIHQHALAREPAVGVHDARARRPDEARGGER